MSAEALADRTPELPQQRSTLRAGSDADPDRLAGDAHRLAAAALRHLA